MTQVTKDKDTKVTNQNPDNPISKDMPLFDIVHACPDTAEVLLSWGLHCFGYHVARVETLEQGAKAHGLNDADVTLLLAELNAVATRDDDE